MTPKFKSRYPLLLPRPEDMTPRWERIAKLAEERSDIFTVTDLGDGFRSINRNVNEDLNQQVIKILTAMHVSTAGISNIAEVDPIQIIPPMLRSLWTGRGYKVAEMGLITLEFNDGKKYYQYPFIEVT